MDCCREFIRLWWPREAAKASRRRTCLQPETLVPLLAELGPTYFEQIFNLLNAVETADHFLRHLLLEEGIDISLESHRSFLGFHQDALLGDIRAGLEGHGNLLQKSRS